MSQIIHFLGLNVHKESISVSNAPSNSTEVRHYGRIGGTLNDVDDFVKKLQAAVPKVEPVPRDATIVTATLLPG